MNFLHSGKPYFKDFLPSKHFLFSKTSSRRLEDVFSVTLFVFQDLLKMSSQDVFARRLAIMSSRRLGRQKNVTLKTSSRSLQDVFSTSSPRRMFAGLASMKMITELIVFYFLKLQFMAVIKMIHFVFFYQYSISFIYSVYCISLSITIYSFICIIFSFISVFFFFLFVSFFA